MAVSLILKGAALALGVVGLLALIGVLIDTPILVVSGAAAFTAYLSMGLAAVDGIELFVVKNGSIMRGKDWFKALKVVSAASAVTVPVMLLTPFAASPELAITWALVALLINVGANIGEMFMLVP